MSECINYQIQNLNMVIGYNYWYARNNVRRFQQIENFENPQFFESKILDKYQLEKNQKNPPVTELTGGFKFRYIY